MDTVEEALGRFWDEAPKDEIYEPVVWKVGDAVQVLPRPECAYCEGSEWENGRTGVVINRQTFTDPDDWTRDARAHRYWVEFDVPAPDGCNSPFAACELTLLSDDNALPQTARLAGRRRSVIALTASAGNAGEGMCNGDPASGSM